MECHLSTAFRNYGNVCWWAPILMQFRKASAIKDLAKRLCRSSGDNGREFAAKAPGRVTVPPASNQRI